MKGACALMLGSALLRRLKYVEDIDADLEDSSTGCLTRKMGAGTPSAASAKMFKSKLNTVLAGSLWLRRLAPVAREEREECS